MKPLLAACVFVSLVGGLATGSAQQAWHLAEGPLKTRWTKEVSPNNALPEYPRPQMVRREWRSLNGIWDLAITSKEASQPTGFTPILVPYPVESALSGVRRTITEKDRLWYRRQFEVPRKWTGQRVWLHFGAVDFETMVWVNDQRIGEHQGGYDGFSFDITDALKPSGPNELKVAVWDPTDAGPYARGKQVRKPDQGIFYTACSGIWQTVWLEPVPAAGIAELRITPDVDAGCVRLVVKGRKAAAGQTVEVSVLAGGKVVSHGTGKPDEETALNLPNAHLWSPDDPYLYDLKVILKDGGKAVDSVGSYLGMRKVALGKDEKGVTRIFLNNRPFFMLGPLDQGFWPDGIYTAPTDAALRSDIEITRKLGFNMARKHVKVEPERWYYWADKLGLLVWQDMPAGDRFIGDRDPDITRSPESARQFEAELEALVHGRYNHPSIVMWVVFNEGWGQYDTARLSRWVKSLDPSRLVNNASGWADRGVGDVHDMHNYPGPGSPKPESDRAAVLGEFGGLGFRVDGHTWAGKTWGYRGMGSREKLTRQYAKLLRGVYGLKADPGLSAAVYTQTTDVEYEGNGLLTYDREVVKMDPATVLAANLGKLGPEPKTTVLAPTAKEQEVKWRYTTEQPRENWIKPEFDVSNWREGSAGFGTQGTPGALVRTEWRTGDIWLRRQFELSNLPSAEVSLRIHHDDDVEIYINGVLAYKSGGASSDYDDYEITPEGRGALKQGQNIIAVHCHQRGGGQYIDVGMTDLAPTQH